jgi:hypothetical protein
VERRQVNLVLTFSVMSVGLWLEAIGARRDGIHQSGWLPPFDDRKLHVFCFISKVPWLWERIQSIIATTVIPVALAIVYMHYYPSVLKK